MTGSIGDDGQAATLLPGGGGLRCHDAAEGRVLLQYSDNILGPAVIAPQWINSGSVTGGIKRMSVRDRAARTRHSQHHNPLCATSSREPKLEQWNAG
jgi:hypothetical protein